MSRLHLQYFLIALVVTCAMSLIVGGFLLSLVREITGAAFVAALWTAMAAAGGVAIMAGRRAAKPYIEPRYGQLAGTVMGVWSGAGSMLGIIMTGVLFRAWFTADVRVGLTVIVGFICLLIGVMSARIAGRQAAHPPEEEV
jgi:hypothetical protein